MSILAPVLDPLVDAYVPAVRTNETLKNDLLSHCQDILKRYTLTRLIGLQLNCNHLVTSDRERKQISLILLTWLNVDVRSKSIWQFLVQNCVKVLQLSPNGSSTSRFTNLMARLLDQVGNFSAIECRSGFIAYFEASPFEKAGNNPFSSNSFIIKCTTAPDHLNADFGQSTSVENAISFDIRRTPCTAGRQNFVKSWSVKRLPYAERWLIIIKYRSYAIPTAFIGVSHLPEPLLFRDALYLMQGISGKYVRFVLPDNGDKRIVFGNDHVSAAAFSLWYLTLISFFCL